MDSAAQGQDNKRDVLAVARLYAPVEFRDLLLDMARSARIEVAA